MVRDHKELKAYIKAFSVSTKIFELSKEFPKGEMYSLTDQIRRSSRSVCANLVEAWRFLGYPKSFKYKLNISEAEAAETQFWLDTCLKCGYINKIEHNELIAELDEVIALLVSMRNNSNKWCV